MSFLQGQCVCVCLYVLTIVREILEWLAWVTDQPESKGSTERASGYCGIRGTNNTTVKWDPARLVTPIPGSKQKQHYLQFRNVFPLSGTFTYNNPRRDILVSCNSEVAEPGLYQGFYSFYPSTLSSTPSICS